MINLVTWYSGTSSTWTTVDNGIVFVPLMVCIIMLAHDTIVRQFLVICNKLLIRTRYNVWLLIKAFLIYCTVQYTQNNILGCWLKFWAPGFRFHYTLYNFASSKFLYIVVICNVWLHIIISKCLTITDLAHADTSVVTCNFKLGIFYWSCMFQPMSPS